MVYVIESDFLQVIDQDDLDILKTGGSLDGAVLKAVQEASTYLAVDYDTDKIFDVDDPIISEYVQGHIVDIALYHLHARINPRNIPEIRVQRRDDAVKWLKDVANPRTNITAPKAFPRRDYGENRGSDISWGSRKKRNNYY